jgi:SpoVK/Ycf46/Vps4 family AAA+-type ATPase
MSSNKRKNYTNHNTPFKIDNFNKYLLSLNQKQLPCENESVKIETSKLKNCDNYKSVFTFNPEIPSCTENIETKYDNFTEIFINVEINTISDLIDLISTYPSDDKIKYNINMKSLHNIKEPLIELNNMIGMEVLKKNIVDQIIYFIQDLHKPCNNNQNNVNSTNIIDSSDFLHTVIYGPPGTGKTEIAKLLGKIFSKMNILSKGTFRKVTRSDLIAGYLGQTAIKTRDVIKDCLGGVLFIDEAYSLGNIEKRDSFSKECIDTLCEALSDHKDNLMVIIAGYENELENCFFNYNQGLSSRFTWRYKTDEYSPKDLYHIFIKKINDIGWVIHEDSKSKINPDWFAKNKDYFKFYGRDIETFLAKTKIVHSRRVFCKNDFEKKKITIEDMEKGLLFFLNNNESKNRKESEELKKHLQFSLYS